MEMMWISELIMADLPVLRSVLGWYMAFISPTADMFLSSTLRQLQISLDILPRLLGNSMAVYAPASLCSAQSLPYPIVFGAEFFSLQASLVSNYSRYVLEGGYQNAGSANVTNASFCNVTVSYTHPGQNDSLNVQVWLPIDSWNGRLQVVGGGGYQAGMIETSYLGMTGAISQGYATATTDAGHTSDLPEDWALLSPGNVNLYLLQDLASVSLNDAAIIAKSLTKSFYGRPPDYSYWNGCSQGGRQGMMLAQRYPEAFDGIAASAPAISWPQFGPSDYWPQLVIQLLGGKYPYPCELNAITAAAVSLCDGSDGVVDGLISDPDSCKFDPYSIVGNAFNCTTTGLEMQISEPAAAMAKAAWTGAKSSTGRSIWPGVMPGASLTGPYSIAGTECDSDGTCVGNPLSLYTDWIRLFVKKDPTYSLANMTQRDFEDIIHASIQQYSSIIGANDPDLSQFREAGGKLISYHGLVSPLPLC
jgi:hypothetical protein